VRVVSVVGARPQFIKAAPVHEALRRADVHHEILHSGQHHDHAMSQQFFAELGLPPPIVDLGVAGGSNVAMVGRMIGALEPALRDLGPDVVLVYGDTNTTLAGAYVAASMMIPLAHVEAGLRSGVRRMAEERNRVLVDHLAQLLLCPTPAAVVNLHLEGVHDGVHHVGDVMYDIALRLRDEPSTVLDDLRLTAREYVVVTVHRAETTDVGAKLREVLAYVEGQLGGRRGLLVAHPRLRDAIERERLSIPHLELLSPLGYVDMARLVGSAAAVFTDSGGLQKEAYFHRVPCVTLRDETEWPETIAAGWNRLWTAPYLDRREIDDFGQGDAAQRVADLVTSPLAWAT
jgi:UDP-GlcNAc3NAcA epimerase